MKRTTVQRKGLCCLCIGVMLLCGMGQSAVAAQAVPCSATRQDITVSSRFAELFFGKKTTDEPPAQTTAARRTLIPGGEVFGVKIATDEVLVADVDKEACGLRVGDRICEADGVRVHTAAELSEHVRRCGGRLSLTLLRDGERLTLDVPLEASEGGYHLGVTLRDGTAGIGTVTFYDPQSGVFGGLGHGICDAGTGDVLPMREGLVTKVTLGGIKKGESGKPGELHGVLRQGAVGILMKNCPCGVFGRLAIPDTTKDALPVASREEVHEGDATILCTVHGGKVCPYTVTIRDIDYHSDDVKSFTVTVTDKALIAMTGGIVRGMSGSPILQDGRLIGAVTHVCVNL